MKCCGLFVSLQYQAGVWIHLKGNEADLFDWNAPLSRFKDTLTGFLRWTPWHRGPGGCTATWGQLCRGKLPPYFYFNYTVTQDAALVLIKRVTLGAVLPHHILKSLSLRRLIIAALVDQLSPSPLRIRQFLSVTTLIAVYECKTADCFSSRALKSF